MQRTCWVVNNAASPASTEGRALGRDAEVGVRASEAGCDPAATWTPTVSVPLKAFWKHFVVLLYPTFSSVKAERLHMWPYLRLVQRVMFRACQDLANGMLSGTSKIFPLCPGMLVVQEFKRFMPLCLSVSHCTLSLVLSLCSKLAYTLYLCFMNMFAWVIANTALACVLHKLITG